MIVNISYKDKDVIEKINKSVGKPFSFWQTFKMRGIGSERLLVAEGSVNLYKYFGNNTSSNFCNIELRPEGIVLRFRYIMDVMAWVIPYRTLAIFKSSNTYTLHSQGEFLIVKPGFKGAGIDLFMNRVLKSKNEVLLSSNIEDIGPY